MTYIFDCEVFAFDWLFVFKNLESKEYTIIHNDNDAVKEVKRNLNDNRNCFTPIVLGECVRRQG